jgi:hypothetical protein
MQERLEQRPAREDLPTRALDAIRVEVHRGGRGAAVRAHAAGRQRGAGGRLALRRRIAISFTANYASRIELEENAQQPRRTVMLKKVMMMGALAAACALAQAAAPIAMKFTWEGLRLTTDPGTGTPPDPYPLNEYPLTVIGYFTGADLDGNGTLVASELIAPLPVLFGGTGFDLLSNALLFPPGAPPVPCCSVTSFSYSIAGNTLDALVGSASTADTVVNINTATGEFVYGARTIFFLGNFNLNAPGVTLTVTPIPEPASCALTLAGLGAVVALRRRKLDSHAREGGESKTGR